MNKQQEKKNIGLMWSVINNKCPHCREGKLFTYPNPYRLKTTLDMPANCTVCNQPFELQAGFYFGTGYVSYGLSVLYLMVSFVFWYFVIGISIYDNSIFWWLGINSGILLVLQPILQRLSRSIWIAFFVKYSPTAGKVAKDV